MVTRIAEGLQGLLDVEAPEKAVRINILLRSDLTPAETRTAIEQIRAISPEAPVEVLETSKSLTATLPLRDVPRIAALANVFWIDLDHEAPLETLLDTRSSPGR